MTSTGAALEIATVVSLIQGLPQQLLLPPAPACCARPHSGHHPSARAAPLACSPACTQAFPAAFLPLAVGGRFAKALGKSLGRPVFRIILARESGESDDMCARSALHCLLASRHQTLQPETLAAYLPVMDSVGAAWLSPPHRV
jgi:hypothetical protein